MAQLAEPTREVIEVRGVRLPVDPTIMSEVIQDVVRRGEYENGEAKSVARILEAGDRVLELGGGIGYLSALIGTLGLADHIVTVEANPALIPVIRATHALNGVKAEVIHGAAVADEAAEPLRFSLDEHFWASSLTPRKQKGIQSMVEVPAAVLGELVRAHRPTFLIVDVEGSEVELLTRAEDIAGVNKVLIEVHDKAIGPHGVKQLFDFFSAAGFYLDVRLSVYGIMLFRRLP